MNDNRGEESSCCYFHPREAAVGICALCLKERLIILAAKQGHVSPENQNNQKSFRILRRKPTGINLSKVFALGSFLHLLQFKSQRPPWDSCEDHVGSDEGSIASIEDSFISIKFTDKGQASWDCKKSESLQPFTESTDNPSTRKIQAFVADEASKSVVEHAKTRARLRWRTRIGHLFHAARWKRSSKAGACHVGMSTKMDGPWALRSWI